MDERNERIFFALLRAALRDEPLAAEEREMLSDEYLRHAYDLAKSHDVAVLIAYAIDKSSYVPVDQDLKSILQRELFMSVHRYETQSFELRSICKVLSDNGIWHIPLKGSVLREHYPSPWLRTSCDIDVLIHPEDLENAKNALISTLEYKEESQGSHEVSLYSRSKVHLELHFELNEPMSDSYKTLDDPWSRTVKGADGSYTLKMTDELFYFYHIAHMAKHFMNGGCGIRPLLDLWILDNRLPGNEAKRGELLEREGLLVFSNAIKQLSRVWLCLESHNELTVKMQNYLLLGGIYGNLENRVKLQQVKSGGKRKYAIAKIFLPYEKIKHYYPILKKHKWLTPFMQVRRWFRIIFCGGFKRSVKELSVNERISDGSEETKEFLNQIGL